MRVIIVSHRTLVVLRIGLPPVCPVIGGGFSKNTFCGMFSVLAFESSAFGGHAGESEDCLPGMVDYLEGTGRG